MKFVNRGYLSVKPTKLFIDWANEHDEDFAGLQSSEASIYLIEEEFYDDEPVLKSHFKSVPERINGSYRRRIRLS